MSADVSEISVLVEKVEKLIAILALANRQSMKEAADELRSDQLNGEILESMPREWTSVGELWEIIGSTSMSSRRTVQRRLSDLVSAGALTQTGVGSATKYRPTGLV